MSFYPTFNAAKGEGLARLKKNLGSPSTFNQAELAAVVRER